MTKIGPNNARSGRLRGKNKEINDENHRFAKYYGELAFSEVSKKWAGIPLTSLNTMLGCMIATTTQAGLTVTAQRVDREYERGIRINDDEMKQLNLKKKRNLTKMELPHQTPERTTTPCSKLK